MPEAKLGRELGISGNPTGRYAYADCKHCGKRRLVEFRKGKPRFELCQQCRLKMWNRKGDKHPAWKGGKHMEQGYIVIWISPNSPFYPMQKGGGFVKEHRLVIAKHLRRCLKPWEIVHHKNGIKTDNRLDNLELLSWGQHEQITILERQVRQLEQRMTLLEAENILLREKFVEVE